MVDPLVNSIVLTQVQTSRCNNESIIDFEWHSKNTIEFGHFTLYSKNGKWYWDSEEIDDKRKLVLKELLKQFFDKIEI